MQYVLGIDIGTTGVKAVLFDSRGEAQFSSYKEYPIITTEPGMAELDPKVILASLVKAVKQCSSEAAITGKPVSGCGLSCQLHSIMFLDKQHTPLTRVLCWADTRPLSDGKALKERHDVMALYAKTGCRVEHPMYPLNKILWIRRNSPHIFFGTAKIVTLKTYIVSELFKECVIDYSDASGTGLFNIRELKWDDGILHSIAGIEPGLLPEPVPSTYLLMNLREEYARQMGITQRIPWVIGGGDGVMANIACGAMDPTVMSCTIGTSGALRVFSREPKLDDKGRTWCFCFDRNEYVIGGSINNGGLVLRWLRDTALEEYSRLGCKAQQKDAYELFNTYASEVAPGSDGVLFFPYLTGQRSPFWKSDAKAAIHGLQLYHSRKHIVRAAMEGVLFNLYMVYQSLCELARNPLTIIANGGYVSCPLWLQMQADIFNKEIRVSPSTEASALGAAYAVMVAMGVYKDFSSVLPHMKSCGSVYVPSDLHRETYRSAFRNFTDLYSKLYGDSSSQ